MSYPVFVRRRSYQGDLIFQLDCINSLGIAQLRGCMHRIIADAPVSDLIPVPVQSSFSIPSLLQEWQKRFQHQYISIQDSLRYPIRILHIDSDPQYLKLCLSCYEIMKVQAAGAVIAEYRQPQELLPLLHEHHPDILIITGHDALPKGKDPSLLLNYKSSCYFAEAVRKAREYEPDPDRLIICAGACQSYSEKLLAAGANFASSPGRILIHALDPVIVCEMICFTPVNTLILSTHLAQRTYSGTQGIGCYPTFGRLRIAE